MEGMVMTPTERELLAKGYQVTYIVDKDKNVFVRIPIEMYNLLIDTLEQQKKQEEAVEAKVVDNSKDEDDDWHMVDKAEVEQLTKGKGYGK